MGYSVYDVNGYVGDLASIGGLHDLFGYLRRKGGLADLTDDGWANINANFFERLARIPDSPKPDIQTTLENLRKLAKKCKEVIIISDSYQESGRQGKHSGSANTSERATKELDDLEMECGGGAYTPSVDPDLSYRFMKSRDGIRFSRLARSQADIRELGLSERPLNVLRREGIETVSELARLYMNLDRIFLIHGLSKTGVSEIGRRLRLYAEGLPDRLHQ